MHDDASQILIGVGIIAGIIFTAGIVIGSILGGLVVKVVM